jgi:hypothetical protein
MAASAATPIVINHLFTDTSDLDVDPSTRIISLSDIHGDIDALIIALRDCAKVIEPVSGIPSIGNNVRDPELDRLLNLDLMDLVNMQDFDRNSNLNFRWNGGNTHVVLVGDIIDPIRKDKYGRLQTATLPGKRNANDLYPQAEIKILKFLNKLDEIANYDGGRVIKLIGNHEFENFKLISTYPGLYSHEKFEKMPYTKPDGEKYLRDEFFNINNPGFHLFMERGSGIFLRINNILFMHGQLYNPTQREFNYIKCDEFNKELNKKPSRISDSDINEFNSAPQLWDREYGDYPKINVRITDPLYEKLFCDRIVQDVTNFLGSHPIISSIPAEKFKIVIGHCPQSDSTYYTESNRTFTTQNQLDEKTVELRQPARTFIATPLEINTNNVFGISMECPTQSGISINDNSDQHHRIYKVDVGVSRGFDQNAAYGKVKNNHEGIKQYFLSRVPQVLELQGDNVRILRSTVKNTRVHQFRYGLENELASLPNLQNPQNPQNPFDIENMSYGGYKQKYLKYKQKYIELKQKLNS